MNTRKMEAAVIGALNIDITGSANVPFSSSSSLPGTVRTTLGGTGWNAARACALLGLETEFFSVLARDGYEVRILAEARRYGVGLDNCRWEDGENGCFLSILDAAGKRLASVNDMTRSRRMDGFFCGDAARKAESASAAAADCDLQADALNKLSEKLAEVPLVVNCVSSSKCMRAQSLLPRIHTLLADAAEAEKLTGYAGAERCATALLKQGASRVCVLLGGEGLLMADREDMLRLNALSNAGGPGLRGAVTGALCVSLARGLDLEKTAKLALAASAVAGRSAEAVNPELARLKEFI